MCLEDGLEAVEGGKGRGDEMRTGGRAKSVVSPGSTASYCGGGTAYTSRPALQRTVRTKYCVPFQRDTSQD